MELNKEKLLDMYGKMIHIRKFEENVAVQFSKGKVHGTTHLYIGEEATAVGACSALEDDDLITSTHRGHGHCIAKGIDLNRMMAEFLGKASGYCRGKGGSMHIADLTRGNLGANGVVAGGIPIAVGAGLSIQMRKQEHVVLCFFGDGAMNEGAFHEAVNLASIWKLPIIFLCENNYYGMSMCVRDHVNISDLSQRALAYGIPGRSIDGNNVIEVWEAVRDARCYVRQHGPMLIVARTYRWAGHSKSDANRYRSKEEIDSWKAKDPIPAFRRYLVGQNLFTEGELKAVERTAIADISRAMEFAESCPFPSVEGILEDVYAQQGEAMREITYATAIREAMSEEMRKDENVFLLGEDVGLYGGAFGVTRGMIEEFGAERVRDTPISEAAIAGAAIGAALTGMRPIAEIMFSDFTTIAMDQLVNQAAKIRFMFGGSARVPLVLRTPAGSGTGAAAQHSQSPEAWFCHVPGLKVVAPSTPRDAKGLLKSAIADDNPVIFFEQKLLYPRKGSVPKEEFYLPLGRADVKREGRDVSIITYGRMVDVCLNVARSMAEVGIEIEVVDPRTLFPLDKETIINSAAKTGRVLIVHEAVQTGGVGGEIAAVIADSDAFYYLDAPIKRLCGLDVPIPYCPELERNIVPTEATITKAVYDLMGSRGD